MEKGDLKLINKRKYIFLGGIFPKEIEEDVYKYSKGNIQNAANNLQWELINGLNHHLNGELLVINSMYIGSFPKRYSKLFIGQFDFQKTSIKNKHIKGKNIKFLNLPLYKNYSRYKNIVCELNKIFNNNKEENIIIAYAMTGTMIEVIKSVKESNPGTRCILIVPDLPKYMSIGNDNYLHQKLKSIEIKRINKNLKYIDGYIFLTDQMNDYLSNNKPYEVIEGIAPILSNKNFSKSNNHSDNFKLLYTGTLAKEYGIKNLVDTVVKINKFSKERKIELTICGSGFLEKYIKEKAIECENIVFNGQIPREDVLVLQQKVDLLINPRRNTEEFTKYSFPSKILEYMSTGTPVLAYKLDGMPNEYLDKMFFVDDFNNDLEESISTLMNLNEKKLKEKGDLAKKFVGNQKNNLIQTQKIINLINRI